MDWLKSEIENTALSKADKGIIATAKPASQIQSELESSLGNWIFSIFPNRPKFVGRMNERTGFLFRNSFLRNDFRRLLYFEIKSTENGSEIHYTFKQFPIAKAFIIFWITAVIVIGLTFLPSIRSIEDLPSVVIPAFMIIFGISMYKWGHLFANHEETEALEFLKELSDPQITRTRKF